MPELDASDADAELSRRMLIVATELVEFSDASAVHMPMNTTPAFGSDGGLTMTKSPGAGSPLEAAAANAVSVND